MFTSEVPVEVMQPLDLGLQFVPHRLLQGLSLSGAFHEGLVILRYPLDLLLQLKQKRQTELKSLPLGIAQIPMMVT